MKPFSNKILLILPVVVAFLSISTFTANAQGTTGMGTCPTITSVLMRGSSGNEVVSLQTWLSQSGYDSTKVIEKNGFGYFGQLTEKAVKALQIDAKIESTGQVGQKTKAYINAHCQKQVSAAPKANVVSKQSNTAVNATTTTIKGINHVQNNEDLQAFAGQYCQKNKKDFFCNFVQQNF